MRYVFLFFLIILILIVFLFYLSEKQTAEPDKSSVEDFQDSVFVPNFKVLPKETLRSFEIIEVKLLQKKSIQVNQDSILQEKIEIDSAFSVTESRHDDALISPPNNAEGKVMRVIDGDTSEIFINGHLYKVRYLLIDTPETHDKFRGEEPFGREAFEFNKNLVEGKVVRLEKDITDFDKYGRLLRYVYLDSIMVNLELIRLGLAKTYLIKPDGKHYSLFAEIQEDARKQKLGIWSSLDVFSDSMKVITQDTENEHQKKMNNLSKSEKPQVIISQIFYDGIVPRVESDEFIEILNTGNTDVSLEGWKINAGNSKQNFKFPHKYILQAGEKCRVYTNEIHPESGGFSFQSKKAIWKNSGDIGYLVNNKNELVYKLEY